MSAEVIVVGYRVSENMRIPGCWLVKLIENIRPLLRVRTSEAVLFHDNIALKYNIDTSVSTFLIEPNLQ